MQNTQTDILTIRLASAIKKEKNMQTMKIKTTVILLLISDRLQRGVILQTI